METLISKIKDMCTCNCKIRSWANEKFEFTDHTLLCYHGFKTQFKDPDLNIKTGNIIQEFQLCNYCYHFKCKAMFTSNRTRRIRKRKICSECLAKQQLARDFKKIGFNYSPLLKKWVSNDGHDILDFDELNEYLEDMKDQGL